VAAGADIQARDRRGNTPLHTATEHPEMFDVMAQLIAAGADVNARNAAGLSPLDIALRRQENDKVDLLRRHGAGGDS
jgi:ankyrin repeat protein